MKKQVVYSLDKRIPIEVSEALAKAIDKKNHCNSMIKSYTDDWVVAQKKIIYLTESIKKLKGETNE